MKTDHSGATDIGLAREANEDSYLIAPPLFVVADGLGGHAAGDVASQLVVEVLKKEIDGSSFDLVQAVADANSEVYQKASENSALSGMGSTVTAILTMDDAIEIAHVGDSRAYLLRNRTLSRLTEDHTFVERLVREGRISPEEADHHPQRSRIERALGVDSTVEIDSDRIPAMPGDRLMICSDGLTNVLSDEELAVILLEETNPNAASRRLIEDAVQAGAADNVTVVVVDLPGQPVEGPQAPASHEIESGVIIPAKQPIVGISRKGAPGRRRALIITAVVALVLVVAVGAGRAAILSRWFVGTDGSNVTVFRGVPGSFAGIEVREEVETTEVRVEELPEIYQRRVTEGISAEDATDAKRIIDELKDLAQSPLESGGRVP